MLSPPFVERVTFMYRSLKSAFFSALLVFTSATWPTGAALGANLVYTNSFDAGWTSDLYFAGGCYSYSFALEKSTVREGTQGASVVNKGWEDNMPCRENEPKHRAQIRFNDTKVVDLLTKLNAPTWIGFSVFVPTDHPVNQSGGYIMAQLNGSAGGPEFEILMEDTGSTWKLQRRWAADGGSVTGATLAKVSVKKGQWTDFVIYRERSWKSDGITKIWIDGKQVVDHVGPNAINYVAQGASGAVRLSTGIYWGTDVRNVTYELKFDAVRIAEGLDGYSLVAAGGLTQPPAPTGLELTVGN